MIAKAETSHSREAVLEGHIMGAVMNTAWETWSKLARSGVMGTLDGRDHMLKRHDIVVRIIEANSRRLRLDNEINGLDIERRSAERDLKDAPDGEGLTERFATIDTRLAALREESSKLDATRAWLDQSLAEFDGSLPPGSDPATGRA